MGNVSYSLELCRKLLGLAEKADLKVLYRPRRYDEGDILHINFTTVWPEINGQGRFRIEKFVGGGFAGQVYRCVLDEVKLEQANGDFGLKQGSVYAIKIMIPPTRFTRWFRDLLYWIAFQAPFSATVNEAACRAGLLWPKLVRMAMSLEHGTDGAGKCLRNPDRWGIGCLSQSTR